ncbi:TIGR03749 family integrating conjugative element protein [Salmonella enterica subsp. enterica]|nr:TIGR03749 family integrating conjugative element protein [Salmonella enterica subsp. enterica]MIF51118.1 TIGR03749 family integrating conjugative element protein [Salmonella enterica subsp. enterica]
MIKRSLSLLLLLCPALHATELMQWDRIPLPVALHTGHERVLFINKNVRVGYPVELNGKLSVQSSGGTVYLKAKEPFPAARLQLRDVDSGELILLDIDATDGEALEPVELRYDDAVYSNDEEYAGNTDDPDEAISDTAIPSPAAPVPVVLTRYAAQMLYAPLRTVEPVAGIREVAPRLPPDITTLLPTEPVSASPLNAWQLGDDTVTAIKLQNRSPQRIDLDPRTLQGVFYAATFQHSWLGAKGTPEDTTVVYLVTRNMRADRAILPEPTPAAKEKK